MLKRFFISMLGTIAGIWIASILLVITIVVVISSSLANSTKSSPNVEKNSILHIELVGSIPERVESESLRDILLNGNLEATSLCDIIRAVELASDDKKIDGIFLDCKGADITIASCEELGRALKSFSDKGKYIVAYSDSYTQNDYYLASFADQVILNPMGSVGVHGLGGMIPFFKGLLDKVGVKVQVIKVGTYKSAVEPFILSEMSEPARRQNQIYVDSIWSWLSENIAENIEQSKSTVNSWATGMIQTWTADSCMAVGAVTDLKYRRQVEEMLADFTDSDEPRMVGVADYLAGKPSYSENKDHIAVLYLSGDIVDEGETGFASECVVPEIITLAENDNVLGLIIRVDSGGGSAFASEQIWEALEYFKSTGKPFYVSMGSMAASGAYYISCGADRIYADDVTLTGSIGVFGLVPDFSGLVTDKLGITFNYVESGKNAVMQTGFAPMNPEQYAAMQRSVEDIYDTFTSRVAEGRHMSQDSVKVIGEGRVWVAPDALRIGLIDRIATLGDAVSEMAEELDIEAKCIVEYPRTEDDVLMTIIRQVNEMKTAAETLNIDAATMKYLMMVEKLRNINPMQARMAPVEIR